MGAFGQKRGFIWLVLAGLLYSSAMPDVARADGKDGDTPPAKTETATAGAAKVDAPAPLTERERWLLDRVEQLEKRMAELEAKGHLAAPSSSEAVASQPSAVMPATAQPGVGGSAANGEVTTAVPAAAVSVAPQEKASTTPAKAEPFAFADFTWLNGNSRTKDTPYAHQLLHPGDPR